MSSHWPTYDEWLRSLSAGDQKRARALTERFRSLGARDPESWARSEISEGIPQLARFLVLNTLKKHALDYWRLTGALDETAKEDKSVDAVLKQLRQSGFRDADIAAFAQKVAAITAWQVVHMLDEGCDVDADDKLPGWALEELDADGAPTGRRIGGLHESFYEFDPTHPHDDI
jgi:hypothetical protein